MQNRMILLTAHISRLKSEGVSKPHYHPYYQLNHVITGEYRYAVDCEAFVARPGDTVMIPQNCVHSLMAGQEDSRYYEAKFVAPSRRDQMMCDDVDILKQKDALTGMLLSAICGENENMTPFSGEIMVNHLYSILYELSAGSRRLKNAPSKYIEISAYSELVRRAIRFLEDQHACQLSLDHIAAHIGVRKSYLCRRFKEETSTTIFECLMVIRVRKAVELLTFTGMTLAEIMKETGFVNLTHFNRVFTKHVMIPPGHYRRHTLKGESLRDADSDLRISPIVRAALYSRKIDFAAVEKRAE